MKMLDRRRDVVNFGVSYNHPRLRAIAKGADPIPLTCTEEVAANVAKQFGGEVCRVKPGEYKRSPNGAVSVCMGARVPASGPFEDSATDRPSILDTALAVVSFAVGINFAVNANTIVDRTALPDFIVWTLCPFLDTAMPQNQQFSETQTPRRPSTAVTA